MQIHVFENAAQVGQAAATLIAAQVISKPDSVLGLATGSTPIPTYQELARLNKAGVVDFAKVRSFNLDEYCNLPVEHEQSYHSFMKENLFDHINIDKANTHVPCGIGADHEADAKAYDEAVEAAGGIDLQILGIGHDGHIGFNEPGDEFVGPTNIVTLTDMTIDANTRFFEKRDDVPRQAITLGNRNIMAAKHIILLATGKDKAQAIAAAVKGNITPKMPASLLQVHPNVQFLLDEGAASLL